MWKYLIVLAQFLLDQYECDADRTPVCMVSELNEINDSVCSLRPLNDASYEYEVYEVGERGSLRKLGCLKDAVYDDDGNIVGFQKKNAETEIKIGMFIPGNEDDDEEE